MDEKKMHELIEKALETREHSITVYLSPDGGCSVSIYPWPGEEDFREAYEDGKISYNDYRKKLGLRPVKKLRRIIDERKNCQA